MTNNFITVFEALSKVDKGQSLDGYAIDFQRIKIESLDVMKLSKAGIQVPEEAVYYDEDIAEDDAFEGDWVQIEADPIQKAETQTEVKINVNADIKKWIDSKNIHLDKLVENLIENFYKTQKEILKE